MGDAFMEVFGKLSVADLIIYGMAIGYASNLLKKSYQSAKKYFAKEHEKELEKEENVDDHKEIFDTLQEIKGQNNLIVKGLSAVLSDRLYHLCESVISKNEITLNELESIKKLYDPYHAFGFNGTGTKLYNDCMKLPVRK